MHRSHYAPFKGTIDGDLCQRHTLLANNNKHMIASELDRLVKESKRKTSIFHQSLHTLETFKLTERRISELGPVSNEWGADANMYTFSLIL